MFPMHFHYLIIYILSLNKLVITLYLWLQGLANGDVRIARLRSLKQRSLYRLGRSIHRKTHVFFLPLLLGLGVVLAGFKAYDKNSEFDQLWVESKLFSCK